MYAYMSIALKCVELGTKQRVHCPGDSVSNTSVPKLVVGLGAIPSLACVTGIIISEHVEFGARHSLTIRIQNMGCLCT